MPGCGSGIDVILCVSRVTRCSSRVANFDIEIQNSSHMIALKIGPNRKSSMGMQPTSIHEASTKSLTRKGVQEKFDKTAKALQGFIEKFWLE